MISGKTALCGAGIALIGAATSYMVMVINGLLPSGDWARTIFSLVGCVVGLVFLEMGTCVQRAKEAASA